MSFINRCCLASTLVFGRVAALLEAVQPLKSWLRLISRCEGQWFRALSTLEELRQALRPNEVSFNSAMSAMDSTWGLKARRFRLC